MRASHYAQAFHDLVFARTIEEGTLVKQFVATVKENGHAHLFRKILRSLERIMRREEKQSTIEVTSAAALSKEEVGTLLKKEPWKHVLSSGHKKVVRKTDETLIGGMVLRTSTAKIDASHKRALLDLYQSLTSQ
ncbi:MAG: F0F1 ATP synthase subunit delta [bacterium]|nr:F0F1 ATP synthase subunit delta [bacterium]